MNHRIQTAFLAFVFPLTLGALGTQPALALDQELQFGYVYDTWNSNFIYHGEESRYPLSYKISGENFSFNLATAFISGDYEADGVAAYRASDLSDTAIRGNFGFPMGNGMLSSFTGSFNIPTGNTGWEAQAATGAVPYDFVPSYYHGRGIGGDLYYSLASSQPNMNWSLGAGYMRTTSYYNSGILSADQYSPWGAFVGMAAIGFPVGPKDDLSFRFFRTFPLESTAEYPIYPFTMGAMAEMASQWSEKLGKDRLQVTAKFDLYNRGSFTDPTTYSYSEEDQTFLGNRLTLKPFLGWIFSPGVVMETGIEWKHVFSNNYSELAPLYQGGGDLIGAQQSITFQMDSTTFLNVAGQYQYVDASKSAYADMAHTQLADVTYNRFSVGTNVGWKW